MGTERVPPIDKTSVCRRHHTQTETLTQLQDGDEAPRKERDRLVLSRFNLSLGCIALDRVLSSAEEREKDRHLY